MTFTATLLEVLDAPAGTVPWPKEKITWRQSLTLSWLKRAMTEGLLFKEMLERSDGRVLTPVSIDLRTEAEKVAKEMGLPLEDVLREAETVLKGVK